MKHKGARGLLVLLSLCLLMVGVAVFGEQIAGSMKLTQERRWKEKEDEIYASVAYGFGKWESICLWKSEEENCFYLFLPAFWEEGETIKFYTISKKEIILDGKELPASGKAEGIKPGQHELVRDGERYSLYIMKSENIPALFLDMEDTSREALYEVPYTQQNDTDLLVVNEDKSIEAQEELSGIRVRGNTSADWVKKPYQLTMKRATGFFGMDGALKWNLLSNWSDKTLLRNQIAYDLGKEAGLMYSPESRMVDLYLNGEYQGNYQLCEKIEIGPSRIAIQNLEDYTVYEPTEEELDMSVRKDMAKENPQAAGIDILENGIKYRGYDTRLAIEDMSGGYLLEIERPSRIYGSPSFFITAKGQPVTVKSPQYADEKQVLYIAGLWQSFEDALYAEDGKNPGTGIHYTEYIDFDSFVKKYLVEEIVRNYDASSTSQYFYKDSDSIDGKIYAGPVWDYDMSLGNPIMNPLTNQNYISSVSPYGLFAALPMDDFTLWYRLWEKEDFRRRATELYSEAFLPQLQKLHEGKVWELAETIERSALMDGIRWDRFDAVDMRKRQQEYREQVKLLNDFIKTREYYLTGHWLEGRESKRVYLDGGNADMYISYVEGLVGDVLEEPLAPVMEGYTFERWLNGYTKEPYDFTKPYDGSDLYFVAQYRSNEDGSVLIAGE